MSITPSLRFRVFTRDNFACVYCGRKAPDVQLAVDHLVPRAAGGTDHSSNLVTACFECNAGKSDAILSPEFIQAFRPAPLEPRKSARRRMRQQFPKRARVTHVRRPKPEPEIAWGTSFSYTDAGERIPYYCVYCGNLNVPDQDVCSCARRMREREAVQPDYCWECGRDLSEYEVAEFEDVCEDCYAASHRRCEECDEPLDGDECPTCGVQA